MTEDRKIAYQKAYGDRWEQFYSPDTTKTEKVETAEKKTVEQEAPVLETSMTRSFVAENAPTQETEDKPKLVTPQSKAKEAYPSLFSLFTEMMSGKEGDKSDDVLVDMFTRAFEAMMGIDAFKERLEKREKELQEELERERQARIAAEQKLEAQQNAPETKAEPVQTETHREDLVEKSQPEKTFSPVQIMAMKNNRDGR